MRWCREHEAPAATATGDPQRHACLERTNIVDWERTLCGLDAARGRGVRAAFRPVRLTGTGEQARSPVWSWMMGVWTPGRVPGETNLSRGLPVMARGSKSTMNRWDGGQSISIHFLQTGRRGCRVPTAVVLQCPLSPTCANYSVSEPMGRWEKASNEERPLHRWSESPLVEGFGFKPSASPRLPLHHHPAMRSQSQNQ